MIAYIARSTNQRRGAPPEEQMSFKALARDVVAETCVLVEDVVPVPVSMVVVAEGFSGVGWGIGCGIGAGAGEGMGFGVGGGCIGAPGSGVIVVERSERQTGCPEPFAERSVTRIRRPD